MNIAQVEEGIKALIAEVQKGDCKQEDFIYQLLLTYGHRKQSVTRLRSGERNLASKDDKPRHDVVVWKRHVYFKHVSSDALHSTIDEMRNENMVSSHKIRFLVVTDFNQLLAVDTKTTDSLDVEFTNFPKHFDFFLPWSGMEKAVYQGENPADVKAAEKMAKLFDLIKADNFDESNSDDTEALHNLNVFLTRLLFCFFAEDTEIFQENQFSNAIRSHTNSDGGDLSSYLDRLFEVLNTAEGDRKDLPEYLQSFPYVNGGLFADTISSPKFSAKSRRMLIECGSELDWSDINPDIFGSMIQAVVHPSQRGGMGMHYTSVTNIMKVIEPLFLNDLYEELEKSSSSKTKLQKFQQRLGEIKIFDPACGSGNFLIIAYKELRKLEMELLKQLQEIDCETDTSSGVMKQKFQPFSVVKLSQFYGIELDDFAHEVAILSLWLAEHQMNTEFKLEFGEAAPSLPLRSSGGIFCGNAARMTWQDYCDPNGEVYILGNPPYVGARNQDKSQKQDVMGVFESHPDYKNSDYVACWVLKASQYIAGLNSKFSFVTTNSISQGEQVAYVWERVLRNSQEIYFAYPSFKWRNSAKNNAGVTCIIFGVRNCQEGRPRKYLYDSSFGLKKMVGNIGPYITESSNVIVKRTKRILSWMPKMIIGSMARDGGNLILSENERASILEQSPSAGMLIKSLYGTNEWIKGVRRYAIWIDDNNIPDALSIPEVARRVNMVKAFREESPAKTTNQYAKIPHRFAQRVELNSQKILVPATSSERRRYIPIGFMPSDAVVTNSANLIPGGDLDVFGIVSSYLHMLWVRSIGGQLETRIRYTPEICYNTFPVPEMSSEGRSMIAKMSLGILKVREKYSESSIEDLYDPEKMPAELLAAHKELDIAVEVSILGSLHKDDESRLAKLLDLYEKLDGE